MAGKDDRDGFERFYKSVRQDLLLQTYALTGDLAAAEKAVRDAMVIAWHHWRKVSRLEDPGAWVRPLAWSRAQRRHTARWWHRQRDIPDSARATLDALGSLTPTQRKALLLTVLTPQPLEAIAAEVGLSRAALERELQLASAQFSLSRDVAATAVRPLVEALRSEIGSARWPRATILLRAGTTRRRSHTALGVAAAVAATVVSGSLVTDADGATPALAGRGIATKTTTAPATASRAPDPEPPLGNGALLTPEQVGGTVGGTWAAGTTSRNTEGNGLNITCQRSRYADPQGVGALVRTFSAPMTGRRAKAGAVRTAVQEVERSTDDVVATRAYELARSWYGACTEPRLQLVSTHDVGGVADAATLVVLRAWGDPARTLVIGVARTGALTTTVATATPGDTRPDLREGSALLAASVADLCATPGGGTCPTTPVTTETAPVPVEAAPAMIGEMDLPQVGTVTAPWAGTAPAPATTNDAATRCDDADFSGGGVSNAATRSFLIPEATRLPPQFGLTETVGSLPAKKAAAFVEQVRERLATCTDRDLGTEVTRTTVLDRGERSMSSWNLRVEIDDDRFVDYKMAIMRSGTAVAQLGFIAAEGAAMDDDEFAALCERAMQRLAAQPPPA